MINTSLVDYYVNLPNQIKSTIIITVVLVILSILIGMRIKKLKPTDKPGLLIHGLCLLVDVINNFIKQNIGKRWKTYAPYFLTLAIFLFFANTSSIWGLTPPTSYVSVNAALAIVTFLLIQITGIVSLGFLGYLKSFVGPVWFMAPIMIPINLVGELTFPLSLCLRLFGNILSGNVISMLATGALGGLVPFAGPVLGLLVINPIFDIAFGLIQVLVFVLLSIIFISMKVDDKEKIYN